jgi:hypothetical protein
MQTPASSPVLPSLLNSTSSTLPSQLVQLIRLTSPFSTRPSLVMTESYYAPRLLGRWLNTFFRPIRTLVEPVFEGTARDNLGLGPAGRDNNTRPPSNLDKHMDRRHQLKRIRYHAGLLQILIKKLDDRVAALPQDSRIDDLEPPEFRIFSSVVKSRFEAANEAQLQYLAGHLLRPATEMSSILCFLLEEESDVETFPIFSMPSTLATDAPDDEIRFSSEYHTAFSSGSRPLKTATVKAIRCFGAALTFLK